MHEIRWHTAQQATEIWKWLPPQIGEFGTVGGDIPPVFARYVSIPNSRDPEMNGCSLIQDPSQSHHAVACPDGRDQLARLVELLGPTTGAQPLHCAIWEGFGGMFRTSDGFVEGTTFMMATSGDSPLSREELDELQRQRHREYAARLPLRPPATTLALPDRAYYTWTTTLSGLADDSAALDGFSPTIVMPADRSWLWHSEIDGRRTEIGGPADLLEPLVTEEWAGLDVDPSTWLGQIPNWGA